MAGRLRRGVLGIAQSRWCTVGLVGSVLTTVGGTLLARLPDGSSLDAVPGLVAMHDGGNARPLGLALGAAGLIAMTAAWLRLLAVAPTRSDGAALVRRTAFTWSLPMAVAPPLFSGDGWSYVADGYLARLGLSPYDWTPASLAGPIASAVSPRWIETPSPYGPLANAWGAGPAHFTSDPYVLLLTYRVLALAGLMLLATTLPELARRCRRDPRRVTAVVVGCPLVLVQGVGGLHLDLVMVGLMALAAAVADRRWWPLAAAIAGGAAAIKLPGGLVDVAVVLMSLAPEASVRARVRRTFAVAAISLGVLWLTGWVTGEGAGWSHTLAVATSSRTPLAPVVLLSILAQDHLLALLRRIGEAATVLAVGWALLRHRLGSASTAITGSAGVLLVVVLLLPVVRTWYFLWPLPFLAVALDRATPAQRAALVAAVAALGLASLADPGVHVPGLGALGVAALVAMPLITYVATRRRVTTPVALAASE